MDFTDTDPRIQELLIKGYRRMSPQQKMLRVNEMSKSIQQLALARIQREHPHSSKREQLMRLGSLWIDRLTMTDVFGWDPEIHGY